MTDHRGPTSRVRVLVKFLEDYALDILDNKLRVRAARLNTELEETQHERERSHIEEGMAGKWFQSGGSSDAISGLWTGVRVLGTGGQGSAGLFLKLDDKHSIMDRMAVKEGQLNETDFDEEGRYVFRHPGAYPARLTEAVIHAFLSRPMRTNNEDDCASQTTEQPPERIVPENPRKLKRVGQGMGIINYRNQVVFEDLMRYRMYMDYADTGDLMQIMNQYYKDSLHSGPVPEPYLWFTFYHLMLACKRMDDITIGKPGEVIHQDIKFLNVFLDKPDPLWFPQFPIPKMGDWGSAQFTFEGDDRNPVDWRGNDPLTPGWQPPEYRRNGVPRKLTSSINVWQCAMIIRIFMQVQFTKYAKYDVDSPSIEMDGFDGDTTFANYDMDVPLMDRFNGAYSQELMDMISRCLSDKVDHRYKPQQVIDYIEDNFDRFFQGAEDPGVVNHGQYRVLGVTLKDDYMPGMVYQRGPGDTVTTPTRLTSSRVLVQAPLPPRPAGSDVDLAQAMDRLNIPRSITSGDLAQAMNHLRVQSADFL